jgi:hypothetical protein
MTWRRRLLLGALVLAPFVFGFLTMTDPPPEHPQPEPSPAFVGDGEVPEIAPAQP